MATRSSTRGVKGRTTARYAVERCDRFDRPVQLLIADEDGHRLFTMVRISDVASFEETWELHFRCPDPDCRKELVVAISSLFGDLPKGVYGERFCDCGNRRLVAVVGKNGTVRTACHKVEAHADNPHMVIVNPRDVLGTIERTEIREAIREERKRFLPLGGY